MIMADGNRLTADCLAPEFHAAAGSADPDSLALDDLERRHILRVLEHTRGNKAEAAHAIPQTRRLRGEISPSPSHSERAALSK